MTRDIQNRARNSRTYRNMFTSSLLVQSTYTRDWTETQRAFETEAICRDFSYYDGNAESFHILSRNDLRPGLYNRLTAACLGAIVKYPYFSDKATVDHPKFGAFDIDSGVFDAVMVELGLKQNGRIVKAEKEGRQAVSALLSKYMDFLKYVDTNRVISEENRENVLRVLGDNFLECRGDRPKEWWRHVILDYIVGMTDDYMKNEHVS